MLQLANNYLAYVLGEVILLYKKLGIKCIFIYKINFSLMSRQHGDKEGLLAVRD